VLDHGLSDCEILQRHLVPEGNILVDRAAKFAVVLGDDTEHVRPGSEVLDHHDTDVVAAAVHEQVGYLFHASPGLREPWVSSCDYNSIGEQICRAAVRPARDRWRNQWCWDRPRRGGTRPFGTAGRAG